MTLKNVSVGALKSLKITEAPQNKKPLVAHTKTSIPNGMDYIIQKPMGFDHTTTAVVTATSDSFLLYLTTLLQLFLPVSMILWAMEYHTNGTIIQGC